MQELILFFSGILITLGFSFIVILYLRSNLKNILIDLCGNNARADFWMAFSNILLVITPVIFAMFTTPGDNGYAVSILKQLRWSLTGLIGTVLIIGSVLRQYVNSDK